jgi:hypothetical protein
VVTPCRVGGPPHVAGQLEAHDLSRGATEAATLAGTVTSFAEAARKILPRLSGLRLSKSTVDRVGEELGRRLGEGQTLGEQQAGKWSRDAEGKTVAYVSADLTGMGMQGEKGRRHRAGCRPGAQVGMGRAERWVARSGGGAGPEDRLRANVPRVAAVLLDGLPDLPGAGLVDRVGSGRPPPRPVPQRAGAVGRLPGRARRVTLTDTKDADPRPRSRERLRTPIIRVRREFVFYGCCEPLTLRTRTGLRHMANVVETPPPAPRAAAPAPLTRAGDFLTRHATLALFLVSVLGLFLELLLIRWISTEIRIFAYLQNTVLVVCFLGLGMGCWSSRRPFALRDILLPLGVLVALLAIPPTRAALGEISTLLGGFQDFLIWAPTASDGWFRYGGPVLGLVLSFMLMVLLWETFVPVGRLLGRLMNDHPNTIAAYSANVAGSLVGIWLFVLASALYLPPAAWFVVFGLGALAFLGAGGKSKAGDLALLAGIVVLAAAAGYDPVFEETRWTPYQKLSLRDQSRPHAGSDSELGRRLRGEYGGFTGGPGQAFIAVNNTGYQATVDLRPETVAADPQKFDPAQRGYSQYDLPARLHPHPKRALVVGAGSGNDAAGMLRNGVDRVVAVEIDPGIIEFGCRLHAEKPYDDPRCVVVNDDARSYFATCTETFDVIGFGLLDSHTTNAMTNARLDHYVYTVESLIHARKLLNPGGVMVLSFEAQKPFVADRMASALEGVFGHKPVIFRVPQNGYGWGGLLFVMGDSEEAIQARIAANPGLPELVAAWQATNPPPALSGTTRLAVDDWPYIYLEQPAVPVLYFLLAGVLGLLFARGVYKLDLTPALKTWAGSSWHFFFLGAAFMLLEVQNISKAAVVLGNTWTVNAVIISGVMVMILLANLVAARFPRLPLAPVYGLLVASCVGLYFLDLSRFAFLPYTTKALVVGLLTSLPMLFSGVVFIRSFAAADRKDAALAANLMGSLAGGLLQSVTFVVGIKALLLIVAGLYLAAVLLRPKPRGVGSPLAA